MEVVPNSSGEGSTCDEEMSQEFPPLTGATETKISVPTRKSTDVQAENDSPLQASEEAWRPSGVLQDQQKLISYLNTLMDNPSPSLVIGARKKALQLDKNLKAANLSNQAERKKLSAAHSDLLSQCNSQEELSQGAQPLKTQLLQLATKQKQLLECFRRQKEINATLSKLEDVVSKRTSLTGIDALALANKNPQISAITNKNSHTSAAAIAGNPQISDVTNKTSSVADTSNSSCGVAKSLRNSGHFLAAFPNLAQHLRQPSLQAQTNREPRQHQNQSTALHTSAISQTTGSLPATLSAMTQAQPIAQQSQPHNIMSHQEVQLQQNQSVSQVCVRPSHTSTSNSQSGMNEISATSLSMVLSQSQPLSSQEPRTTQQSQAIAVHNAQSQLLAIPLSTQPTSQSHLCMQLQQKSHSLFSRSQSAGNNSTGQALTAQVSVATSGQQQNVLSASSSSQPTRQTTVAVERSTIRSDQRQTSHSLSSSISISAGSSSSNRQVATVPHQSVSSSGGSNVKVTQLSSDFAQPVPLVDLIKHGFIKPGSDAISCIVMGCEFKASLLEDGSIKDHHSTHCQLPQQWLKSCWAKLGHTQRKPNKKTAYTSVLHQGVPLLQYCEKYSLKQVKSYLSENDKKTTSEAQLTPPPTHSSSSGLPCGSHSSTNEDNHHPVRMTGIPPAAAPLMWGELESMDELLRNGQVLLHCSSEQTSLKLPSNFWSVGQVVLTETLCQLLEQELHW